MVAVAVAALAVAGVAAASAQPRVTRVPWDGRVNGGARFVTDGAAVWILSGRFVGANVWRIDSTMRTPKRTRLPNMFDLIAGDRLLWGIRRNVTGPARVSSIDVRRDGYTIREKRIPRDCRGMLTGHAVFRGRLWFKCDLDGRYVVLDPRQAAPAKTVRVDGELLKAAGALWLLDLHFVLRCLEGSCSGRGFPVGSTGAWGFDRNTAWLYQKTAVPGDGLLTLVAFRSRATVSFPIKVPDGVGSIPTVRVVGDELWIQGSLKHVVARYGINDPKAQPRLLRLPGIAASAKPGWPLEVGGGYAWVTVDDRRTHKVFRVTVPRDPPALRRMRATLARELDRSPQRFGVPRAAGFPLHVSCEARKVGGRPAPPGFRQAAVFRCEVLFKGDTRNFCAAIVRDRLVVDRTHNACRD